MSDYLKFWLIPNGIVAAGMIGFVLGGDWVWLGIATFPILAFIDSFLPRNMKPRRMPNAFLATAPVAIPGIVLGVGLFLSYTRPPLVLYGTLWILLLAFLTIELPAAYQQLQSAFRSLSIAWITSVPSW